MEKTIEKICYASNSQSISYREIYQLNDKKIKIEIKSDSYHNQCYARASVLKDDDWNIIYTIPYSLMQTPEGLAYKSDYKNKPATAETNFKEDVQKLRTHIEKILF
ncbi:MAG: hypothetical protein PHC34_02890 [Candidatus Gastranaerophilales bacterium]|nr:hypothetical protein [Candidatus Gastranaerophilales bacterium]